MYKKILLSVAVFMTTQGIASDDLDIDSLLLNIEKKTDLSEKTKLENSGISFIYTREDLKRMQVHYLKDLLKAESGFGYNENKYGLPDPMMTGDAMPYMSSLIKVYIDNQEITAGMYGSGLIILGDINMGFVDHVEIYTHAPSYEFSAEPALTLVRMYSKKAQKDEGSKVTLEYDTNNASRVSFYNTQELSRGWSYFAYSSFNDDKRKKIPNRGTDLSRNKERMHLLATLSNENHHILLNATYSDRDAFIGLSPDATPETNNLKTGSLHLGYDGIVDKFSFLLSYDYLKTDHVFTDNVVPLEAYNYLYPIASRDVISKTDVLTAEIKYRFDFIGNHLVVGVKDRQKWYEYPTYNLNGVDMPKRQNTTQIVWSGFVEDQYSIMDNLILNAGIQLLSVKNPDAVYNDSYSPKQYRYGLTYLKNQMIFKVVGSYAESYLEPYIIDSSMLVKGNVDGYKQHNLYLDFIYAPKKMRYEVVLGKSRTRNYLLADSSQGGLLNAYKDIIYGNSVVGRISYEYREFDKLFFEYSYLELTSLPDGDYKTTKVVLRSLNSYNKFDFSNELIFDKAYGDKYYYDYNFGVKYELNEDLIFSLKVENLFDKAKESKYIIQNPETLELEDPLFVPLYDRKVDFSVEYLF